MRRTDWVVSPQSIINRACIAHLITDDEAGEARFLQAAQYAAEDLRDSWPEGEGYGSSDFTFTLKNFLHEAGIKAEFVEGRLTRVP